jgi:hypothetical protein
MPLLGFDTHMASRFLTILTSRNLPKIQQAREPEPSIINENTIADFTRLVEETRILHCEPLTRRPKNCLQARTGGFRAVGHSCE